MENILDIKKTYLSHFTDFENSLNGGKSKPVHELRKSAISKFSDLHSPQPETKNGNTQTFLHYLTILLNQHESQQKIMM